MRERVLQRVQSVAVRMLVRLRVRMCVCFSALQCVPVLCVRVSLPLCYHCSHSTYGTSASLITKTMPRAHLIGRGPSLN